MAAQVSLPHCSCAQQWRCVPAHESEGCSPAAAATATAGLGSKHRPLSTPIHIFSPNSAKMKTMKPASMSTLASPGTEATSADTISRMLSTFVSVRSGRNTRIIRSIPTPVSRPARSSQPEPTTTVSIRFHESLKKRRKPYVVRPPTMSTVKSTVKYGSAPSISALSMPKPGRSQPGAPSATSGSLKPSISA